MQLLKLLDGIQFEILKGNIEINIEKIQYDSRKVKEGDIFVAIEGFSVDGHKYIDKAIEQGASVIVLQKDVQSIDGTYTVVKVQDSRQTLALISSNYYGNPSKKLKVIGITGTNGKTTITYMVKSILEQAGNKVGLIGTIANYIGQKKIEANRTTPESLELQQLFSDMADEGVEYCIMEVSSHSLALDRVYGVNFEYGLFTNLTQDHLDFHKTFEEYFKAKLKLFNNSKTAIINIDDAYGKRIIDEIDAEIVTYSLDKKADITIGDLKMHSRGIEFELLCEDNKIDVNLMIPGKYNVANALGAAAVCYKEGFSLEIIKKGLEEVTVPGRCEIVTKDYNLGFEVIVDYAHTPDGLENILKTAREFTKGRLITVFGCGGDRDKTKRPIMGSIASDLSDIAVVTSDNPRSEQPEEIIEDILKGIKKENHIVIVNRRDAINKAIEIAAQGDVIVVAGKGHEDYQEIKGEKFSFDEKNIIKDIIDSMFL